MKTATRLWYNIAALFSTITATCARYVTDVLYSGRMPNHLLDRVTQPRANSTCSGAELFCDSR